MASNSKKRRRVLGVSCILAALIIASSSFAWFTSQDEVTNRLSANADYDVSIVESFAPPKNWLPGENVNKDVYALNTGSIGAYVNEDVSGVLSYTVEHKLATWEDGCVELTEDEVDSVKAGAYLAGAFDATTGNALVKGGTGADKDDLDPALGGIYEYFDNGDGTDPKTTDDFTPTKEGLYFFRRSIKVADDLTETFKYEGYYFKGGKYYKLADIRINEIPEGKANDNIDADGNLTKCPTVAYAKETTAKVTPTLRYEPAVTTGEGAHPQRLVATASTGTAAGTLDGAAIDTLAKNADHALETLNEKKSELDAAETALENATSAYDAALVRVAYYAGDTNKKTIAATDLTAFDATGDYNFATQGSAIPTNIDSAGKIVAPGVLKPKIDEYNTTVAAYNALSKPADYENLTTLSGAVTNAASTVTAKKTAFESAKSAYETAAGYPYTAPVTNPDPTDPLYIVWNADKEYQDAVSAYDTAKAAYDTAKAAADTYDNQVADYQAKLTQLRDAIVADVEQLNAAITERDNQNPEGTGSGAGNGTTAAQVAAETAYKNALSAYETALKNYNDAARNYEMALGNDTSIEIYINLSDDVVTDASAATNDKWQLMPIVSGAAGDTVAHFYYTGILPGGESSSKLIDSVELSKDTTQDDYKSFDFDLNINLDSAQINYADDQVTIKADAVNTQAADGAFEGRKANLTNPTSLDTPVLWN